METISSISRYFYFAFESILLQLLNMALRPLLRRCSKPGQAADAFRTSFIFGVRGFASGGEQLVSLRSQHSTCDITPADYISIRSHAYHTWHLRLTPLQCTW